MSFWHSKKLSTFPWKKKLYINYPNTLYVLDVGNSYKEELKYNKEDVSQIFAMTKTTEVGCRVVSIKRIKALVHHNKKK